MLETHGVGGSIPSCAANLNGAMKRKRGATMTITAKYAGKCKKCNAYFAVGDRIEWEKGEGSTHVSDEACAAAVAALQQSRAPVATANLKPIADFLHDARGRGLKYPKLRVLDTDGQTELVLSLTGKKSKVPGSVCVLRDWDYVGVVRPSGDVIGRSFDNQLVERLKEIAGDPAKAASDYGALMGSCSFCGKSLTDAGSVAVGYGPVCAKKWGLKHVAAGTPSLQVRELVESAVWEAS
jgi:hypothetical protein